MMGVIRMEDGVQVFLKFDLAGSPRLYLRDAQPGCEIKSEAAA
jgi:hypothetical protein